MQTDSCKKRMGSTHALLPFLPFRSLEDTNPQLGNGDRGFSCLLFSKPGFDTPTANPPLPSSVCATPCSRAFPNWVCSMTVGKKSQILESTHPSTSLLTHPLTHPQGGGGGERRQTTKAITCTPCSTDFSPVVACWWLEMGMFWSPFKKGQCDHKTVCLHHRNPLARISLRDGADYANTERFQGSVPLLPDLCSLSVP